MPTPDLHLTRDLTPTGLPAVRLGEPCLDGYLDFLTARCRPNTVLAAGYDLKVFFTLLAKPPDQITTTDVLAFITAQRAGTTTAGPVTVVDDDAPAAVTARTLRRRLSSINGLFAYLHACGHLALNPVPRGLATRRERDRGTRLAPLIRTPRTLPTILNSDESTPSPPRYAPTATGP